ncbi:MAG: NAD(P)H-dependent oxidoreductase subunit E [Terriglobia bacterium]|jgi:NADH-quinone oxidoreductase subunit E
MQLETAEKIIQQHNAQKNALIAMLQDVQNEFSYLPQDVLTYISRTMHVPLSRTYSLATFYRAFSLKPKGRHPIAVCLGTACHVRAAGKILEKFERQLGIKCGQTTPSLNFGLEAVRCLGCCGLAPVVTVGPELYGKVSLNKVDQIIKQHSKEGARDAKA